MESIIPFLLLGVKIIGIFVCSARARALNRSANGWGAFGFVSPIIAMIWIYCLKPITKWEENEKIS
jgi:hypothetical protein